MGYEIAEQMSWELPDVILYPTGGGTGLIGMWKAFDEMEQMGWISSSSANDFRSVGRLCADCQSISRTINYGADFENAHTVASGLRVPKAIGDFIMLDILRKSGGTAIAVSDEELVEGAVEIGKTEGIFAAPEGGAC